MNRHFQEEMQEGQQAHDDMLNINHRKGEMQSPQ